MGAITLAKRFQDRGQASSLLMTLLSAIMAIGMFLLSLFFNLFGGEIPEGAKFDGARAYEDLETIVGFGPRPSGSAALETTRQYIRGELREAGLEVWEQPFTASTPVGAIDMVNVVGVVEGTEDGVIVIGNHYETKLFEDFEFVGANDAGSSTAWMLEMARALGPNRKGRTVWLVFFDGEEAFVTWSSTDSLYGSRAFVQHLVDSGRRDDIEAMINVDMIGDCSLAVRKESGAPAWLTDAIWATAAELGHEEQFTTSFLSIQDDHIPFRRAGIPAIDIIDFSFGPSNSYWHTPQDTLDKVCPESLQVVGDVIYHALGRVEDGLDNLAES